MQPTRTLLPYFVLTLLLGMLAPGIARARQAAPAPKEPPTRPLLRIETGMHTAAIIRMEVDRAGRYNLAVPFLATMPHCRVVLI